MNVEVSVEDGCFSRAYFCGTCESVLENEDLGDSLDGTMRPGCVADEYPDLFIKECE